MGMFGKSWADALSIIGAGLKDASPDSPGGNLAAFQKMQQQRQDQAQKDAFTQQFGGLLAGQPADPGASGRGGDAGGGQPHDAGTPAVPGMTINDARLPMLALQAQRLGIPLTSVLDVMKAQQPDVRYDRGFGYNSKTGGAAGAYHPDLDKGQALTPGGVVNLPGAVQSASEMAGGVEGAKSAAQAPYQAVQTFGPGGAPRTITAAQLAAGQGGMGQSPAQNAADTARATAGANADINLPQVLGNAQQVIGTIEALKSHPALNDRTGWRGILPATPGTSGADFDALSAQLKGKLFLQAYGDLKGGGQITEVEGKKATDAMARLNQTQTKEGYVKALSDLEEVIHAGASRAAGQSQRLQPNAGGTGAAQPRVNLSSIPLADRLAEARKRGLLH